MCTIPRQEKKAHKTPCSKNNRDPTCDAVDAPLSYVFLGFDRDLMCWVSADLRSVGAGGKVGGKVFGPEKHMFFFFFRSVVPFEP